MTQVAYAPFSFEAPAGWRAHTIAAFFAPPRAGGEAGIVPNIVVTREVRRAGESLAAHVKRQLLALAGALQGFEMRESEDIVVAGRPALLTRSVWRAQGCVVEQTVVHLEPEREDETVTTVTCTASVQAVERLWPVFERLVASLRPAA